MVPPSLPTGARVSALLARTQACTRGSSPSLPCDIIGALTRPFGGRASCLAGEGQPGPSASPSLPAVTGDSRRLALARVRPLESHGDPGEVWPPAVLRE